MDALEQFLGGGQASPTKWTGTTLSAPKLKQLQDAADAGDATAKDVLRAYSQATPVAATPAADPLEAFFSGKPVTAAQPIQAPEMTTGTAEGTMGAYVPRPTVGPVAAKVAGIANKYLQTKQNLGERVAGGIDTLYGIVPATYGAAVQALARTAQTPEQFQVFHHFHTSLRYQAR